MRFVTRIAQIHDNGISADFVYGVVDSNTGVETLYNSGNILGLLRQNPDEMIGGVNQLSNGQGISIGVYQHPEYLNAKIAKLKTLSGLDIIVYKDAITAIAGNALIPVSIRLSDYGTRCESAILWRIAHDSHRITLVLDDNISVDKSTFFMKNELPVSIDIREVTDKRTVTRVYNPLGATASNLVQRIKSSVIDSEDRFILNSGQYIVKHRLSYSYSPMYFQSYYEDFDKALVIISERFRTDFTRLVSDGIKNNERELGRHDLMVMQPLKTLFDEFRKKLDSGESGVELWINHHTKFESALRTASSSNMPVYMWFLNYFRQLGGTEEFRKIGDKYVSDIVDWYLNGFPDWK